MKIKKYALGAVFTPLEWNMGLNSGSQDEAQSASQTQAAPSKEGLDYAKQLFEITNKSGLYSDRQMLAAQAGHLIDVLNSDAPTSVKQKMLMQLQLQANDVTNNYALWKEAAKKVSEEDLGGDLAMNSRGGIYVIDGESQEITTKSLSDIKENSDRYHMLTWNELLDSRNNYTKMAFDMDSIQNVSSAIGMKEIMNQVVDIVGKIGKDTSSGYTSKVGNNVQKGLEYLFAPMNTENGTYLTAIDGLYELKQTDSKAAQNINAAINYIFTHLTDSAKNVVRANAFNMGFDNPAQLIELAIVENIDSSRELKYVKPDDLTGKKSGSGSGNGSKDDLTDKMGYGQMLSQGYGRGKVTTFRLKGSNNQIEIKSVNNDLRDKDGNIETGLITLEKAFDDLRSHGVVQDRNNVTFGQTKIDMNLSRNIVVDASKGVDTVDIPVDMSGNLNFDLINNLYLAEQEIEKNNITSPQGKGEIYWKYMIQTDANGNPKTMRYYALEAKMSSNDVPEYELDKSIEPLGSSSKKKFRQDIEYYNQKKDKKDKIDPALGIFNYRDILSSKIFIPAVVNQSGNALDDDRLRINKTPARDYQMMQETYVDPTQLPNGGYSPNISTLTTNFSDI